MKLLINTLQKSLQSPGKLLATGAPEGFDALILALLAAASGGLHYDHLADHLAGRPVLCVTRDDRSMARLAEALAFFAPGVERLEFPAWDCLPYDRVSPHTDIVSRRIHTLTCLLEPRPAKKDQVGRVVLTTVSALLQRVPARAVFKNAVLGITRGGRLDPAVLTGFLDRHGYIRVGTVMEAGEYAVRGGIIDVFVPGLEAPLRLDFFGDEVDGIRLFDPASQRTTDKVEECTLKPVSEVVLDEDSISRFRSGYRALFGAAKTQDLLYESVSAGRRHIGMEHWLPLFHERLDTLFDYVPGAVVVLEHQTDQAREARLDLIADYFTARAEMAARKNATGGIYNPLPPDHLYLGPEEVDERLAGFPAAQLTPFSGPESAEKKTTVIDLGGRLGRDFAAARVDPNVNVFDALGRNIAEHQKAGRRVLIAAFTVGSRERIAGVLHEHGITRHGAVEHWAETEAMDPGVVALAAVGMERGFVAGALAVISEQDILGDRLSRPEHRRVKPENFIAEASSLGPGDLVVHVDHGIARYEGLEAIRVSGAPHDCLRLVYSGGDKLFLPVENIEVISRFGSDAGDAQLDRLGGAAWQSRKAKLKERIREMADELIRVAAERELRDGEALTPPEGLYEEFSANFPYTETEDQRRAIDEAVGDLGTGRPTDRLICGDVGFGKTEVALRAAFICAMSGRQVAVVVPTTLLARQHHKTFVDRFADYPVRIEALSRMVGAKDAKAVKEGMAAGTVDIVIGTHALLAKDIRFRDLGLLIIDEEQHFGVAHKERLKKLKADVHVLTLTATPIPRTLQLALSGVREMSLIATPPVDRLAVRTFVLPFDPVIIREAILRERFRGGQTFYVCPRIADLKGVEKTLKELVPEVSLITIHGRMAVNDMETAITRFYDGAYDVLISTNIIESGLDLPSVNTIVIHRADMFGLAQLYQLRGRVGRSKVRAYAYLTLPPGKTISTAAEKRLEVMQTLDTLGAGFSLASHDLDIRGAGNLLGEEQSGHIREVGIELYQQMLEEAVAKARGLDGAGEDEWSPQISIGMPVLIPETYVSDLAVRMGLYRRLARVKDAGEVESFAAEMIDRFGPIPGEVENLLQTVAIKRLCKDAGVEKVDAGPKGGVVVFRDNSFANPAGLVEFLTEQVGTAQLRPDHRLVYMRDWSDPETRMKGVRNLLTRLAEVAAG